MVLARWDPFQDLLPLREAMNRLIESSVVTTNGFGSAVPVDVYTEGDTYVIEAALAGLSPEAVNVSVLGNQVTISGEYPQGMEGRQYLFRERHVGRFERTVTLPTEVDADKAEAHFEQGVLRLVVPKAEGAKPRRIAIASGAATSGALASGK